jgi:hypothetical protein
MLFQHGVQRWQYAQLTELMALCYLVTRKICKSQNISKRTGRQLGILRVVFSCYYFVRPNLFS